MKKFLSVLLAAIMVCSMLPMGVFATEADATIDTYAELVAAIEAANAGDTITLGGDIAASAIITIDKAITLDGNDFTLTSTAGRAINVDVNGDVTIENLTIVASGERAINVIQKPVDLTVNNVTATAANYTVNVASSAGAAQIAITDSTLNGLCTVNVSGADSEITITNSTVNCNDNNTTVGESYAALSINKDAKGASIATTNTEINVVAGSDSMVARKAAEGASITIDGSSDDVVTMVAVIEQGDYYYSFETLEDAIAFAKAGDTIKLVADIANAEAITVKKAVTLNLNGYDIDFATDGDGYGAIYVAMAGDLTINGEGTVTNTVYDVIGNYGNVTINGGTYDAPEGYAALYNFYYNASTYGEATINGGEFESPVWNCGVLKVTGGDFSYIDNSGSADVSGATVGTFVARDGADAAELANKGSAKIADDVTVEDIRAFADANVVTNKETKTIVAMVNDDAFVDLAEAIAFAKAGQTVKLLADVATTAPITVTKDLTIDGNGKTLTYTGTNRAITVEAGVDADLTINNLKVVAVNAERGINYNTTGNLTLDNVDITSANYTLSLPGSSDNSTVTVTDSKLTGLNTVNVWGSDMEINITNTEIVSVDTNPAEDYCAINLNNDGTTSAEGTVLNVTGGIITALDENGNPSSAKTNATATGVINISDSTVITGTELNAVARVSYVGTDNFYTCDTLAEAIAIAEDGSVVTLLADTTISETNIEKKITLDLGGFTVTATTEKAFRVFADATIKNGTIKNTASKGRCVDTRTNVELNLTNVTLTTTGSGNNQPLTIGGSDDGTVANLDNVTINAGIAGYAIISFVESEINVENSTLTGYADLYMKDGSANSEVNVTNSALTATTAAVDPTSNFGAIVFEDDGITVTVDEDSSIAVETTASTSNMYVLVLKDSVDTEVAIDADVTLTGENSAVIKDEVGENVVVITDADLKDALVEAGFVVDANGVVTDAPEEPEAVEVGTAVQLADTKNWADEKNYNRVAFLSSVSSEVYYAKDAENKYMLSSIGIEVTVNGVTKVFNTSSTLTTGNVTAGANTYNKSMTELFGEDAIALHYLVLVFEEGAYAAGTEIEYRTFAVAKSGERYFESAVSTFTIQ